MAILLCLDWLIRWWVGGIRFRRAIRTAIAECPIGELYDAMCQYDYDIGRLYR